MERYRDWMVQERCPVCAHVGIRPVYQPDIHSCASCGLVFRSPVPTPSEIRRLYESGVTYRNWEGEEDIRRILWRKRLRLLQRHVSAGRLLDIGTGDGHFLQVAAEAGFEVTATEYASHAAGLCLRRGFEVRVGALETMDWSDARFEVITLWHVLEHLHDPGAELRRIHGLLAPDGVLAVAVPNEERYLRWSRWRGGQPHPLGPLDWGLESHLVFFQPASFIRALEDAGFSVFEFGVDDVETAPTCWTRVIHAFHRTMARLAGWHASPAMFALARCR